MDHVARANCKRIVILTQNDVTGRCRNYNDDDVTTTCGQTVASLKRHNRIKLLSNDFAFLESV